MQTNWPGILRNITLPYEGGKSDNPKDPGGRTNQGVTQATYDGYRRGKSLSMQDVYKMADAERDEIYEKSYWNAVRGADTPSGVDGAMFDGGVMSGPSRAIKWLQAVVGAKQDGVYGSGTLDAVTRADPTTTVKGVCAKRLSFVEALKNAVTFGKGWSTRIAGVEAKCVALVITTRVTPIATPAAPVPNIVATEVDGHADEARAQSASAATKAGGAVVGTGADAAGNNANDAVQAIDPATFHLMAIGAGVILVVVAIYFVFKWYTNKQRADAYAAEAAKQRAGGTT